MLKFDTESREGPEQALHPRERETPPIIADQGTIVQDTSDSEQVTVQELADALAALERKKGTLFPETISPDSVLRQMNRTGDAESVKQAILTRREARRQNQLVKPGAKPDKRAKIALGVYSALLTVIAVAWVGTISSPDFAEDTWKAVGRKLGFTKAPTLLASAPSYWEFNSFQHITPTMKPLSTIKDGEPVLVSYAEVENLQKNWDTFPKALLDKVRVETAIPKIFAKDSVKAPYVRYKGSWYQMGWTTQKPLTFPDPATGAPISYLVVKNVPTPNITVTHGIRRTPPPGATPKEQAAFRVPLQEKISLGPANRPVLVPYDAFSKTQQFSDYGFSGSVVDTKLLDERAWIVPTKK